ncbi:MAG: phycocyanobilin:ferredoxin oxidoreductase [Acaryochloridaceae cyanobacterium SU_2_1]|nr:phycocyanobilin:ferredoxin oxidoreductase [Acaryochloridaceae cyanobacterium SU_2_1]
MAFQHHHPLMQTWAAQITALWSEYLDLTVYDLPAEFGHVEGRLEGEALIIENVCYQAPPFRKLHLELAQMGTGLGILHCVMFPDPRYDLPLFGTDLVGGPSQISAAIVDLSPVKTDGSLSTSYQDYLDSLAPLNFTAPRALPAWGNIFSEYCLFVRPQTLQEETQFLERGLSYLRWHCQQAIASQPASPSQQAKILAAQQRYCEHQQRNDKTRRILAKAFGEDWADRYMTTVLFDV